MSLCATCQRRREEARRGAREEGLDEDEAEAYAADAVDCRHLEARAKAIASIEAIAGKDAVLPLDTVAGLLPTLPEWDRPQRGRRARRK